MTDTPGAAAGSPAAPDAGPAILQLLQDGDLALQGLLPYGSNYTFLVRVSQAGRHTHAVYKPTAGERPLWDFPENSLAFREVAAYRVSQALGWRFVPPTVYRSDGPHGPGSLQYFVRAQPDFHYFTLEEADRPQLRRVALFDVIINNADRKGGHLLRDAAGRLWLIDHGIAFHVQNKLRTVIWDFAGQPVPEDLLAEVAAFRARLDDDAGLQESLGALLQPDELAALVRRTERLLRRGCFPEPGSARSYPWPPV